MNHFSKLLALISVLLASNMAHAHYVEGKLFCDTNRSGTIDTGDEPIGGALIVATHPTEGTFSGETGYGSHPWSGGRYRMSLPVEYTQEFTLFIDESTIPPDSVFISPSSNNMQLKLESDNPYPYREWLIDSASCHESTATPSIEICTEVTLNPDMTSGFYDADTITGDSCDSLSQGIPVGVAGTVDGTYKLTVTNTGTETLINARITAPDFGLLNEPVPTSCGDLEVGESCRIEVSDSNTAYQALKIQGICPTPMTVTKHASVTAVGETSGINVSDDDPASITCTTEPHITLIKEVKLNDGVYMDANTVDTSPFGPLGSDAEYRITLLNDGTETLNNIVINDPSLNINQASAGITSLAPGESIVLTQANNGFEALFVTSRCDSVGPILNTASVEATGLYSQTVVSSQDPAYVSCADPQIKLLKQVSLDGVNFFDADLPADTDVPVGVVGQANAHYRFIVSNIGSEVLSNVLVVDPTLNIDTVIAGLDIGETRVIDSAELNFSNLYKQDVCEGTPGNKPNVAQVDAIGLSTNVVVSDANPANVKCISGPQIELLKQVRLNGQGDFVEADTTNTAPSGLQGDDAEYRLIVRNIGDERLSNIVINDVVLGISNVQINQLNAAEEVILTANTTGFEKLYAIGHCDAVGSKLNIANVTANGYLSGINVNDENPAYINCEAPVSCDLSVDQTCSVQIPSSDNKLCTESISATTLRYTGPDLDNATVVFSGKDSGSASYTNVDLVSNLTVLTSANENGYTIDAGLGEKLGSKTTISINGKEEIIHTSCSAIYVAGAAAPLDGNTPNPSGSEKGDPSPNWDVVNFRQKDDVVITESVASSQGMDSCDIPFGGAKVSYHYKVTNSGSTAINVTSVLDDQLGEMLTASPTSLAIGEMLTLSSDPIFVETSISNKVTAIAEVDPYNASLCSAMDAVSVHAADAPDYSCADGKPVELGITYVGGSCSDSNHDQGSSKSSCSGDSTGKAPVTVLITDKDGDELASALLGSGESFTIDNNGSKFDSETNAEIYHDGKLIQSINFHTSCSVALEVGDQHGGIIISSFTPEAGGSGKGSKGKGSKEKDSKGSKKKK
ncbi:MAG: hypothetical protein ACMZ64_08385 [Oleiphilus sp.]